ncbi:hypothetical protein IEU95_08165 [Hoyosella rhizosphaerae]|uniref:Uncharacterized protein n=1 Tax=Hoyosella rhizosphaerae TaxID=1755582 RepID=A0A916XA69_9ACTN|nr:hypothetical protein [Hoyosella rhizosphaerae]MBN4926802.1 hypothetical protein [Hoyosella rhizosphaerae]GGC56340.1 hypothetical protein GCM10011410_06020 [Hoyosella rhizosphaerae]
MTEQWPLAKSWWIVLSIAVVVTLLDDGGLEHRDPDLVSVVHATVIVRLEQIIAGRITVRILPSGRESVCTIVEDSPRGAERIDVPVGGDAGTIRVG